MKRAFVLQDEWLFVINKGNRFPGDQRYELSTLSGNTPRAFPMTVQAVMARAVYQNEERSRTAYPYRRGGSFFQDFVVEAMTCPKAEFGDVCDQYRLPRLRWTELPQT